MASSVVASATAAIVSSASKTMASATATSTYRAAPQGGVIEGANPSHYDPKNPIIIFIIRKSHGTQSGGLIADKKQRPASSSSSVAYCTTLSPSSGSLESSPKSLAVFC